MEEKKVNYSISYSIDDGKPSTYSLNTGETLRHKTQVASMISTVITELVKRATIHDYSKLSLEEAEHFERTLPILQTLTYGSEEYKESCKSLGPALVNHYAVNSHHPEFYPNGIKDMSLLDIIEMLCDWKAATMRHNDGDMAKSLEINKKRFNISDELYEMMVKTCKSLNFI